MKITLDYTDIKKLIEESYNGINTVNTENEEVEIILNVDSNTFSKKEMTVEKQVNKAQAIPNQVLKSARKLTASGAIPKFEPGAKIDYETLILQKEMEKEQQGKLLATETHIPLVKTLEEKNAEARRKGLMTTGRGTKRAIIRS